MSRGQRSAAHAHPLVRLDPQLEVGDGAGEGLALVIVVAHFEGVVALENLRVVAHALHEDQVERRGGVARAPPWVRRHPPLLLVRALLAHPLQEPRPPGAGGVGGVEEGDARPGLRVDPLVPEREARPSW